MEIFLITFVLLLLVASLCFQIFHFLKLHQQLKGLIDLQSRICEVLTEETVKNYDTSKKVDKIIDNLDRSLLALRDSLEPTKPMKTNNWDSMRAAFKGPTRVEINE